MPAWQAFPHERIELGAAIFALIEAHPGHERAFNRWYERDHMICGGMSGPWTLGAGRYAATRELKALRYPDPSPIASPIGAGSYLSSFFLQKNHLDDQQRFVADRIAGLPEDRRSFDARDHISTQRYRYLGGAFREADGVPAELALERRYPGLVCSWLVRRPEYALADVAQWLLDDALPQWQRDAAGVAMSLVFELLPKPDFWPASIPDPPGLGDRLFVAHFLEEEPLSLWSPHFTNLGPQLEASGRVTLQLCAPFVVTLPGSDVYIDEF